MARNGGAHYPINTHISMQYTSGGDGRTARISLHGVGVYIFDRTRLVEKMYQGRKEQQGQHSKSIRSFSPDRNYKSSLDRTPGSSMDYIISRDQVGDQKAARGED